MVSTRQEAPRAGRLELLSDRKIEVFLQLEIQSSRSENGIASLTSSQPARKHIGSFEIGPNAIRSTAVVLINTLGVEGSVLEITVLLRNIQGNIRGVRQVRLPAGHSQAFFLDEVTLLRGLSGTLELRADEQFLAAALLTERGLPVAPLPLATP